MNPTLNLAKSSMSIQMEAHRNLEGSKLIQFPIKKLHTSFLIGESIGEIKDPFENQVEKDSKVYQNYFSYNFL